jgi:hypothetical protein
MLCAAKSQQAENTSVRRAVAQKVTYSSNKEGRPWAKRAVKPWGKCPNGTGP